MALCSSLFARWRRFLGRLSPAHAALFQLLLLILLAANVVGVIITAQRLQHSYAFPISISSVHHLSAPPPFTLAWWPPLASNASLTCTQNAWDPSSPSCPQGIVVAPQLDPAVLVAGVPNVVDSVGFAMMMHATGAQAGDCFDMQLLGVPMESITADNFYSVSSNAHEHSANEFCPQFATNHSYTQWVFLSFSALQNVHGHVTYSIDLNAQPGGLIGTSGPPTLIVDIEFKDGALQVPWETQEFAYTLMDALTSIFAYANMSFAVIAFLFPWRYVGEHIREERQFKLACEGKKDNNVAVGMGADGVESSMSASQQLQVPMLPRLPDPSPAPQSDRAALAALVKAAVAEALREERAARRRGSFSPGGSSEV